MLKKTLLIGTILLAQVSVCLGDFDTVGLYDPEDAPHHNQVDQSGTYDSHTGNAGPENVLTLADFQALVSKAFDTDAGGVVSGEGPDDSLPADDIIVALFGLSKTKSVAVASTSGNLSLGSGESSGNRLPTSGDHRFAKSGTGNFSFTLDEVTGGEPGERISHFGATLLERDDRDTLPVVTATFTDGSTVTATADMVGDSASPSDKDTFFGFVAPAGEGIVSVNFVMNQYVTMDDIAFITSAFRPSPEKASAPVPTDGTIDTMRDGLTLHWTPGEAVTRHAVYLGTDFEDVNTAAPDSDLFVGQQDANSLLLNRLTLGQTYFWRVDGVKGNTVFQGDVWQFTVEPVSFVLSASSITVTASGSNSEAEGPENTINGSGLNPQDGHSNTLSDMWLSQTVQDDPAWIQYTFDKPYALHQLWIWNHNTSLEPSLGFGMKDVTIEYSPDNTTWIRVGDTHLLEQASGQPGYTANTIVDLTGVAAQAIRITAQSNWKGLVPQFGLSEVRFMVLPIRARRPDPATGSAVSDPQLALAWRAGRQADQHRVYLGTDVNDLSLIQQVSDSHYDTTTLDLQLGETYTWRVDEVNDTETPSLWTGDLWTFSTPQALIIEDYESYGNTSPYRVFQTWIDGYGFSNPAPGNPGNGTGAALGHDIWSAASGHFNGSIMESTLVHGGDQSAPLYYDNTDKPVSEIIRTFDPPQNWSRSGIQALTLYFNDRADTPGTMYVKVNGQQVKQETDSDLVTPLDWGLWKQMTVDLGSLNTTLEAVTSLAIGVEGAGAFGVVYLDDIALVKTAPPVVHETAVLFLEAEAGQITEPMTVRASDPTASGEQYLAVPPGNRSTGEPPSTGIASYNLTVTGGTYKLYCRTIASNGESDSFWVRIVGAATNTVNHTSGWIRWNGVVKGTDWQWNPVFSSDDSNQPVIFTLPAGTHVLEIGYREDNILLDALVLTEVRE
jgi:hypothetical protein